MRFDGHGWGHGIGMSQYGAYGYARDEGRDFRWILEHYYAGTTVSAAPRTRLRVLLSDARTLRVRGTRITSGRRRVSLRAERTYRLVPWRGTGVRVVDSRGHTRARLPAAAKLTGRPITVGGKLYRGALRVLPSTDGRTLLAVDDVDLEQYLYGVVPGEMPSSWAPEALKAQAVAARSYALTSRRLEGDFDVYADTRSQVYGGIGVEAAATTAAVDATRGLAVTYGGSVARTYFHSTSGGRTAAIEEVFFASSPVPYLVSVEDAHDDLSPYHDWTETFSDKDVEKKLDELVPGGELVDIAVSATTPSGRARTVTLTGADGATADVDAGTIRSRLGLRSTWFAISRPPAR